MIPQPAVVWVDLMNEVHELEYGYLPKYWDKTRETARSWCSIGPRPRNPPFPFPLIPDLAGKWGGNLVSRFRVGRKRELEFDRQPGPFRDSADWLPGSAGRGFRGLGIPGASPPPPAGDGHAWELLCGHCLISQLVSLEWWFCVRGSQLVSVRLYLGSTSPACIRHR